MGRISMDVRKLVVKKINEGCSQIKIAKDLSISRRAVQNILKKLRDHNTIVDLPKTGGPALNSARSVRVLIRDSKKNPKKTAPNPLKSLKKIMDNSKICVFSDWPLVSPHINII